MPLKREAGGGVWLTADEAMRMYNERVTRAKNREGEVARKFIEERRIMQSIG